jgi:membrane protein implicated in regulation of membrane protease activity
MDWPADTLTGIYLGLFAFGGIFSGVSLLLGAVGGHFHLPGAAHAGHAPHLGHHGPGHGGPGGARGVGAGAHDAAPPVGPGAAPGPLNLSTLMIFLTWFGATGYLLRAYSAEAAVPSVIVATGAGLVGALIVWLVLAKLLWRGQSQLDPRNYAIMGVTARVTASIGAGGTGEIVYTLDGKRQVDAARAAEGATLPRGTEVAILHRAGGIAYVVPLGDTATDDPFLETGARTATPAREEGR